MQSSHASEGKGFYCRLSNILWRIASDLDLVGSWLAGERDWNNSRFLRIKLPFCLTSAEQEFSCTCSTLGFYFTLCCYRGWRGLSGACSCEFTTCPPALQVLQPLSEIRLLSPQGTTIWSLCQVQKYSFWTLCALAKFLDNKYWF